MLKKLLVLALLVHAFSLFAQESPDELLRQANSLYKTEQQAAAIELYKKLQAVFQKQDKQKYLAVSLQLAVHAQQHEDDYAKAEKILTTALAATGKDIPADSIQALAYHKLGVSYYYLDAYEKAISSFKTALAIRRQLFPETHSDIIKGLHNIGDCYYLNQEAEPALQFLHESLALQLGKPQKDSAQLALTYKVLGITYSSLGNVKKSEEYLLAAESYYKILYQEEPWKLANIYLDMADLYIRREEANATIKYAEKALREYQSLEEKYDEDWLGMAKAYNNLALGYELKDAVNEAIANYQNAIRINEKYESSPQKELLKNYNNIAYAYRKAGNYQAALQFINKALQAVEANREQTTPVDYADFLHTKVTILNKLEQFQEALSIQQKGINLAAPDIKQQDAFANPSPDHTLLTDKINFVEYLEEKGKAFYGLAQQKKSEEQLKAAVATYEVAAQCIDDIRRGYQSDASKSFMTEKAKPILIQAIQAAVNLWEQTGEQQYLEQAFRFAERSKAIILLEAIQESSAKTIAGIPTELNRREQQLKATISKLERAQYKAQSEGAENLLDLNNQLIASRNQLEALVDTFERYYPEYHKAKYSSDFVDIATIQQELLSANQAMIQYCVGEKETFAFYISKEKTFVVRLPLSKSNLFGWIQHVREGLEQGAFADISLRSQEQQYQLNKQYADNAWLLYQNLFAPLAATITLPESLILLPDDCLGAIPFDALLTQPMKEAKNNFQDYPYLIKKHQISYSYSATLLQRMRQHSYRSKRQVLAFAPSFTAHKPVIAGNLRSTLLPLIYNEEEVQTIKKLFPATAFAGIGADKATFLQQAARYSYLHLSTHALVDEENNDFSFVAFTQTADTLDEQQLLYLNDVYNLSLQADMVVLSACQTGLGDINTGEGIISIARAFAYAGASSVVATLWNVNDKATKDVIVHFYEQLQQKHSKDMALRHAKQQLIEEGIFAHPYYWSGIVAYGNMAAVTPRTPWYWIVIPILTLAIVGAAFIYWKK